MVELKLSNIKKSYSSDDEAFRCTNLEVARGKKIGLAGETGSGKSTLLRIIGGLEKPDEGHVFLNEEDVYPKLDRLIAGHPDIAYLSQSFELPKFISVEEFLAVHPYTNKEVKSIANVCDVTHLFSKDTRSLSGGERQRVALAKILLRKPRVLLLDEPFSNLDSHHKLAMKKVIGDIENEIEITVLMVSHDPTDLLPWSDEILVLQDGEVIQRGSPQEVYTHPCNEYVAGLFGLYQVLRSEGKNTEKIVRPEDYTIEKATDTSNAVIRTIKYHGNHDLMLIELNEQTLQVRSEVGRYEIGDKVVLELKR